MDLAVGMLRDQHVWIDKKQSGKLSKHLHCQKGYRKRNCYDNACMESFFSTLKGECADGVFDSRSEAKTSIFEYIEVWYNRKRLHSTLDYLSPLEFEIREAVSTKL